MVNKCLITVLIIFCAFISFAQDSSLISRRIDIEYFSKEIDNRGFDGDYKAYVVLLNHKDSIIRLVKYSCSGWLSANIYKTTYWGKFEKAGGDTCRILYLSKHSEMKGLNQQSSDFKLVKPVTLPFNTNIPYKTATYFVIKDSMIAFSDFFLPELPKSLVRPSIKVESIGVYFEM